MTKIMLVEDDKSLREIYGVRLLAEGYDIVSASDGEQALAVAIKERPALILTDIMMPKISGFDMLDILRSTTETRNVKVIVMTALGSDDQRQRGEMLGADRYLVKSQVGIEDVVRAVHEVLGDRPVTAIPPNQATPQAAPASVRQAAPGTPRDLPPPSSATPTAPTAPPAPVTPPTVPSVPTTPKPASIKTRVIQPISDPATAKVDINELLDRELAKEAGVDLNERPLVASAKQEKAMIEDQLAKFSPTQPVPTPPQPANGPLPTIQIDSEGHVVIPGQQPPNKQVPPNQNQTPPSSPPPPPPPVG